MWIVKLVKPPVINDFRAGFFPRKFHARRDANALVAEVKTKGGEAVAERATKTDKH